MDSKVKITYHLTMTQSSTVVKIKMLLDNKMEIVTVRFILPAEPFFHLLDFDALVKDSSINRVRSLLRMCGMLLGYSFEPRPNSRVLATASPVMSISLSINGCSRQKKNSLTREIFLDIFSLCQPRFGTSFSVCHLKLSVSITFRFESLNLKVK